jgi:hypothetical protein
MGRMQLMELNVKAGVAWQRKLILKIFLEAGIEQRELMS